MTVRRLLLILPLLWAAPAAAVLPTNTITATYTATTTRTPTVTRTASSTATASATATITPTAGSTSTPTQTATTTPTPTAFVFYNADGRVLGIPLPMPTGWCVKILDGKNIGISPTCPTPGGGGGGGGGNLESSGATFDPAVCLDNTVTTTSGQSTVSTGDTLPAGAIVNSCVTRINSAVSGGVWVGLAGAPDFWGKSGGSVDDSNRLDATLPHPARIVSAESVVIAAAHSSGTFQEDDGEIRIVCFCDEIGAPTE